MNERNDALTTWVVDADKSWLAFEARRFGLMILGGRFECFDVAIPADATAGRWGFDLRVAAASVNTANAARDAKLVGPAWLDAARHPHVVFRSRRVEPVEVLEGELTMVYGDLTIRGATHSEAWEFELLARAENAAGEFGAEYSGRLHLAPRRWGLGSAPLAVTVVLHLLVLAGDRIVAGSSAARIA